MLQSHSSNRSHLRQSATQSPTVAGNGHHSRQLVPGLSSPSPSSALSTVVVNPGYEWQESPPSPAGPVLQVRQSPGLQRSLASGHAPQLRRVQSPEDELMRRASELQRRPMVLASSSSRGRPSYDDTALVGSSVIRSPLQPVARSPFGAVRPDGFAVGGNPMLESLYFANVAPPSPEPWDHSTSPIAVMAKPRAFPRTNPAYVGSRSRDGMRPLYRKIDVDQWHAPATTSAPHGRRLTDDVRASPHDGACFNVAADKRRAYRHERSDSDTSHSSFGINRLQQADSAYAVTNILVDQRVGNCQDAFSDSQGSLCQLVSADSLSSHGSSHVYINSGGCGGVMSSPHDSLSSRDSPRRVPDPSCGGSDPRRYHLALQLVTDKQTQSAHNTPTARVRVRRNSEPDYANLPAVTPFHPASQTADMMDSLEHKKTTMGDCSAESMQSGDSLSPVEFTRQHDTAISRRSASTHGSTASNTSEG